MLVTRCRSCLLQKITRYLLQKLLVANKLLVTRCKIGSLLVAEVALCKISLVTRCQIRLLLVAEVARWKYLIVSFSLQNLPVTRYRSCSFQKITGFLLQNSLNTHCKKSFFVKIITLWNYCFFKVNKVKWKF